MAMPKLNIAGWWQSDCGMGTNCRDERRRRPGEFEKSSAGLLSPPSKNFRQDMT